MNITWEQLDVPVTLLVWALASIIQTLTWSSLMNVFGMECLLLNLSMAVLSLICAAALVTYAVIYCKGYIEEARTVSMQSILFRIGFCNSIGRFMQLVGATGTPMTLQLSLTQAILPISATFLVTSNPDIFATLTPKGLVQGTGIFILCTLHAAVLYMSGPASEGTQMLFYSTVYLLSAVPLALSALLQQHEFRVRRVNVIWFLFCALCFDCIVQLLVLFILCVLRDYRSLGIVPFQVMVQNFRFTAQDSSWRPVVFFIASCLIAQATQVIAVRKANFRQCTKVIISIPMVCAVLFAGGTFPPCKQILTLFCGSRTLLKIFPPSIGRLREIPTLIMTVLLTLMSWLYRVTELEKAFVFPKDPCNSPDDPLQLYLPFLDMARKECAAERLTTGVPARKSSKPFIFYPPEILPGNNRLPPVIDRPALLNPWSGWILNEYTDCKRHHDFVTLPATLDLVSRDGERSEDVAERLQRRLPLLKENIRKSTAISQYTRRHISLIYAAEATVARLAHYPSSSSL